MIFKGFHKCENGAQKIFLNNEWIRGEWIQGDLIHRKVWNSDFLVIRSSDDGFDVYKEDEIIETTICRSLGFKDYSGRQMFDRDIVRFTPNYKSGFKTFLVQWNEEGQTFQSIPVNENQTIYRDDTLNCFVNLKDEFPWTSFVLMMQNVYGDFTQEYGGDIQIIGNAYSNPELLNAEKLDKNNVNEKELKKR